MLGDADCALRGRDQCKITASAHGSLHVRIMHTGGFRTSKKKAYRTHLRLRFLARVLGKLEVQTLRKTKSWMYNQKQRYLVMPSCMSKCALTIE